MLSGALPGPQNPLIASLEERCHGLAVLSVFLSGSRNSGTAKVANRCCEPDGGAIRANKVLKEEEGYVALKIPGQTKERPNTWQALEQGGLLPPE
jgi:hypothetical protein